MRSLALLYEFTKVKCSLLAINKAEAQSCNKNLRGLPCKRMLLNIFSHFLFRYIDVPPMLLVVPNLKEVVVSSILLLCLRSFVYCLHFIEPQFIRARLSKRFCGWCWCWWRNCTKEFIQLLNLIVTFWVFAVQVLIDLLLLLVTHSSMNGISFDLDRISGRVDRADCGCYLGYGGANWGADGGKQFMDLTFQMAIEWVPVSKLNPRLAYPALDVVVAEFIEDSIMAMLDSQFPEQSERLKKLFSIHFKINY